MRTNQVALALAVPTVALAFGVAACGSNDTGSSGSGSSSGKSGAKSVTLDGAGSTFAAPVYQEWGNQLRKQGITLNYQAVGSGAGVAALGQGTADFAGSDPALAPEDRSALKNGDASAGKRDTRSPSGVEVRSIARRSSGHAERSTARSATAQPRPRLPSASPSISKRCHSRSTE
jgi:hypothetical protein